jgi:hypothetical protein
MSKSPEMDFNGGKRSGIELESHMHNADPDLTPVMISGPAIHPSGMPLP